MQLLIEKFKQQEKIRQNPIIFFLDIDATISAYSLPGIMANKKTSHFFKKNFIPYILITGRPHWYWFNAWEMKLYGLHMPDAVITGNGTSLLWRDHHGSMEKDIQWTDLIFKNWNTEKIKNTCTNFEFSFPVFKKNVYKDKPLFLYRVCNAPVDILFSEIEKLKELLPKNVRVDISESLLFKNTPRTFSGGIFVVPEVCGKAGAITHILNSLTTTLKNNSIITSYLFGDASIDIPMLSLASNKNRIFHSYLVNPTPLAKKSAEKYPSITVVYEKGPMAIQKIISQKAFLDNYLQKYHADQSFFYR